MVNGCQCPWLEFLQPLPLRCDELRFARGIFLDPLDVYTMYGMVVKACALRVCFLLKSHVRNFQVLSTFLGSIHGFAPTLFGLSASGVVGLGRKISRSTRKLDRTTELSKLKLPESNLITI